MKKTNTKIDCGRKSLKVQYVVLGKEIYNQKTKISVHFQFSSENSLVYSVMEKIIQEMYMKYF